MHDGSQSSNEACELLIILKELVRATGVSGRFEYGFQSELHFADEGWPGSDRKCVRHSKNQIGQHSNTVGLNQKLLQKNTTSLF
jgi:hypothetical protein